jgi:hypothetical protein
LPRGGVGGGELGPSGGPIVVALIACGVAGRAPIGGGTVRRGGGGCVFIPGRGGGSDTPPALLVAAPFAFAFASGAAVCPNGETGDIGAGAGRGGITAGGGPDLKSVASGWSISDRMTGVGARIGIGGGCGGTNPPPGSS